MTDMEFLSGIAEYGFLQRALLAAVVTGLVCGIVGVYMVVRRLVFLAGGITHSAFGGLGIAYYLGINTLWGALAAGLLSAFAVGRMSSGGRMREDSAIGILWSVGMAVGVIFILMTPGYAPNLMSFLFGSILMVTWLDVALLAALLAVLIAVAAVWGRKIIYCAMDSEFARSQRLPVGFLNGLTLCLLSLAVILSIKVVGIMLLISLLTVPAAIAGLLREDYFGMTVCSALVSVAGMVAGIWISYSVDVPSSAVTVVLLVAVMLVMKALKRKIRTE